MAPMITDIMTEMIVKTLQVFSINMFIFFRTDTSQT